MGQPITVVEKPSSRPGIVRFELNRPLSGMGHERWAAGQLVEGDRPVDELARRLFEQGGVDAIHMNGSVVTVTLARGSSGDALGDVVRNLFRFYPDQPAEAPDNPAGESEGHAEARAEPTEDPAAQSAEEPAAVEAPTAATAESDSVAASPSGQRMPAAIVVEGPAGAEEPVAAVVEPASVTAAPSAENAGAGGGDEAADDAEGVEEAARVADPERAAVDPVAADGAEGAGAGDDVAATDDAATAEEPAPAE
ncbi:MAG: hypothetical protein ACR2LQ_07070 [Acidimicrobiales bacterium]